MAVAIDVVAAAAAAAVEMMAVKGQGQIVAAPVMVIAQFTLGGAVPRMGIHINDEEHFFGNFLRLRILFAQQIELSAAPVIGAANVCICGANRNCGHFVR